MPPNERLWTHNRQELAPFDESRQHDECNTRRIVRALRSDLSFDVVCELLAQEQVLGRELRVGPKHQPEQAQWVGEESKRRSDVSR